MGHTIASALLQALKQHGAREIFGIPGDFALPFFRVIEESRILPLYTLSHEPAVGFAADACGRFRSTLGVAAVTYGAGALNMVNAVAAAYAEKSPLVVVSGAPGKGESSVGLLLHHQSKALDSQLRIMGEVTCDQAVLDDARHAPAQIARVLRNCRMHSRPVYLELPRDMVDAACDAVVPLAEPEVDREALAACADEVLSRLRRARSPALMVDVEVRRYGLEAKVAELARRLRMPVVTTFLGRGLLAETDAPLMGTYLGVAGAPEITELVESSDALFLVGVVISDTNFGVSVRSIDMRKTLQALDRRVSLGYHSYAEIPLAALIDALLERLRPAEANLTVARPAYPRGLPADDAPLRPIDIATGINDLMAEHGRMPLACDVGDCLFTAFDIDNTDFTAPGYYATMGYGVPAGLALQAATGARSLVLVGDGAFQMTGWELGNCRRYGWDPIVIVFNNASWEMLRAFQPGSAFNSLEEWRFADIAAALGGEGVRVTTRRALVEALSRAAQRRGRFQLIEAMIARGVLSPTLERFVAALNKSRAAQSPKPPRA